MITASKSDDIRPGYPGRSDGLVHTYFDGLSQSNSFYMNEYFAQVGGLYAGSFVSSWIVALNVWILICVVLCTWVHISALESGRCSVPNQPQYRTMGYPVSAVVTGFQWDLTKLMVSLFGVTSNEKVEFVFHVVAWVVSSSFWFGSIILQTVKVSKNPGLSNFASKFALIYHH